MAAPYDFRRPIQLSREHLRVLQISFDTFARQLTTVFTSALRTVCSVSLDSIEQRTYAEYIDSLDSATYLTVFSAQPMSGRGLLEIPLPAVMQCIDHMLGGHGGRAQPNRPLTDIEQDVFGQFVQRVLAELRYAMAGTIEVTPEILDLEYSPQFAQAANPADVVIVVTCDLQVDATAHQLTMCLPFSGLRPHLEAAVAPATVSDAERLERARTAEQLRSSFDDVPVDVTVRFRPTTVEPGTFAGLEIGDVLRLGHPAAAPLDVCAGTTRFAHATPGARGARLAALIVSPAKENR